MSRNLRPEQQTACCLLREYFFSRTDIVAARQSWVDRKTKERKSQPRPVKGQGLLDDLIAFHVTGPSHGKAPPLNYINRKTSGQVADARGFDRLGSYAVALDNTTAWLCIDFDGPGAGHAKATTLADPRVVMIACFEKCRALGIPAHIEKSGSGAGWHLWVFFEDAIPAVDARLVAHFIAPTDQVLVTGETADIRTGRGIECFPKQNTVSDKKIGAGNMVWLPFWHGAQDDGNEFHQVENDGKLISFLPTEFERLSLEDLAHILDQVPDDLRNAVLKKKSKKAVSKGKTNGDRTAVPANHSPTDPDLILAALEFISPDCPYDDWLHIGMALHEWDSGAGFALWNSWSARGEKYVDGEPEEKWTGFTSGGGVTLGTLFDMAKKAGWEPPKRERKSLPSDEEIDRFMDVNPCDLPIDDLTPERQEIFDCLRQSSSPLGPKEISEVLKKDYWAVQKSLNRMSKSGQIEKIGHGKYRILDILPVQKRDLDTPEPVQLDNLDMSNSDLDTTKPVQNADLDTPTPVQNTDLDTPTPVQNTDLDTPRSPSTQKLDTTVSNPRLPKIIVGGRQLRHELKEAWGVVHASNYPPRLFLRTGDLVRLADTDAEPVISPVNETALLGHLSQIANWVRQSNDMEVPVHPPKNVVAVMAALPDKSLPQLESVTATPVFDHVGTLISTPGYHRDARLWMHRSPAFAIDDIAQNPTAQQIDAALRLLIEDLLVDFPFTSESDRCHALAALLLPFVRRMIHGPTPIHLVEAPTPGTGKSLLAEMITLVCTGRSADVTTFDRDENDTRKKITAILATAPQIVLIDNLRKGLISSQIAAAITAEIWWDRVLQVSKMIRLPNRAMWIATANNPSLSLENARRSIRIRVDAKVDRPSRRTGFKHDPLRRWVFKNRRDLVCAVLTIVRGWVSDGMPGTDQVLGSFESWSQVVGGIVQWAGIPGFLANAEELMEVADAEGAEWREFVAAWWEKFGDRWVIATELFDLALNGDYLPSTLGDKSPRSQKTRLGLALRSMRDRQFGQYRIIVRRATRGRRSEYRLAQVGIDENGSENGPEVLPLFGRRSATSTERLPQRLPENSQQNQEDTDLVDVGRPLSGSLAREEEKDAHDAHAHIYTPKNVYQRLNVYQSLENKEENHGRPLVDVESRSTAPVSSTSNDQPTADLVAFDPEEEKS